MAEKQQGGEDDGEESQTLGGDLVCASGAARIRAFGTWSGGG